jgi:hypothetical protein
MTDAEFKALATIERIRLLHREHKIYDECGHKHTEADEGVRNISDVGLVCDEGYMYSVCHYCCTDSVGDQTEECVSEHDHSTGLCATRRALKNAKVTV